MQKKGRAGTSRAGKIALYGMMTALAFLLSYVETLIPINLGVPGVKLGLANLASIVSLYLLGAGAAAAIALVRIVLVGFTFGNLSMMLYSLAGAAVSLLLMVVFRRYMAGGLAHYLAVQALHLVTLAVCMGGSYAICARMPGGWLGLVPRVLVVLVVPNVLNLAVYGWGRDAAYLRSYAGKLAAKLKRKGKVE